MTAKLSPELANALHANGNQPLQVVDPTGEHVYFVVDGETHRLAMEALRQREDLKAIQNGVRQMEAGEGVPLDEAFQQIDDALVAKHGQ